MRPRKHDKNQGSVNRFVILKSHTNEGDTVEHPLPPPLYKGFFFVADSPYIDSCLNLSNTAAFFCPQGGRFGEVQLSMTVIACEQALCLGKKIASVALFNFLKHNWERRHWKPRQANHAA